MTGRSAPTGGASAGSEGPAVDRLGAPVIDPTKNVLQLVEAAVERLDDLREAERRFNDLRAQHQKEDAQLRAEHQKALDAKESARLDSIRQVDREDVAKTAMSANLAISTLAKQTTDLATTLQAQVQATAQAAETRRNADMSEVNKRVSALELAGSASAGKQQMSDPQLVELIAQMKSLQQSRDTSGGERRGISQSVAILIGGIGLLGTLIAIAATVIALSSGGP